jgi:hypothetical protein
MGIDNKYGRVMFEYGSIGEDEPVFVLRARDSLSVGHILMYGVLCEAAGSPPEHLAAIEEAIDQFEAWQADNIEQLRLPTSAEYWARVRASHLSGRLPATPMCRAIADAKATAEVVRGLLNDPGVTVGEDHYKARPDVEPGS